MKNSTKLIKPLIISASVIIIIPIIFYLWFALGMISTNKSKSLDKTFVSSYKEYINNNHDDIKNIDIYYKQGMINFEFSLKENKSLEEYKDMVLNTRNFIFKDNMKDLMLKNHDQSSISIKFDSEEASYLFESSYYVQSDTPNNDKNNGFIENNYKQWQYTSDNIEFSKLEL